MVESSVTVRLMNEVADPVLRQHLRNILLGAQWRGDALAKAGLADDALCPFCRDAKDDLRHVVALPCFRAHPRQGRRS
eukprot:10013558-Lingulodinium_polyedra.AAC.1